MSAVGDMMLPAYLGFVHWAVREPGIVRQFENETGLKLVPNARELLEKASEFVGAAPDLKGESTVLRFLVWVTRVHWGEDTAPSFYFEIAKQFPPELFR